jgi:hypothetical protein
VQLLHPCTAGTACKAAVQYASSWPSVWARSGMQEACRLLQVPCCAWWRRPFVAGLGARPRQRSSGFLLADLVYVEGEPVCLMRQHRGWS